jgi:hypothetical protein
MSRAREIVKAQAEDPGLWFEAQTAPEAYLQQALRTLHAAIESDSCGHPWHDEIEHVTMACPRCKTDR